MAPPPSSKVFGQTMKKGKSRGGGNRSNYQRQFGGNAKSNPSTVYRSADTTNNKNDKQTSLALKAVEERLQRQAAAAHMETSFGLEKFVLAEHQTVAHRRGWLYNLVPTTVTVSDDPTVAGPERSGLDLYFIAPNGKPFKSTVLYRPYFYIMPCLDRIPSPTQQSMLLELLTSQLLRQFESSGLYTVQVVHKLDLDQPNHLSPSRRQGRPMLKLVFDTSAQCSDVRFQVQKALQRHTNRASHAVPTLASLDNHNNNHTALNDPWSYVEELREYDVPYTVRVCTDLAVRAGTWYTVTLETVWTADTPATTPATGEPEEDVSPSTTAPPDTGGVTLSDPDRESKADPVCLAFDIECTKAPLKFPSADVDEIFMISYMVKTPSGKPQGYLIVSRSVVAADVQDFEYSPGPNYPGPFQIFNEVDERALLRRFFDEYRQHMPQIVVTYNGDFFDWPFVDARAKHHGMDLFQETGVQQSSDGGTYRGLLTVHLDAFHWVQRDSYLPQGSQGLKAVTKYKLGYNPVEVDPEDMVRFAQEKPVHMATYSVSDAVATYYLYEKYVHLFIFSLSTIIPMGPEDVLGKGSGTLCEALLMVEACRKDIICPNKQVDKLTQFHNGHLLESETYIGGKVECLETGVYRSDIEYDFDLKPTAFQQLIDNVDRDLNFAIQVEGGKDTKNITNYDEIKGKIVSELELLRDRPKRVEKPYIYHLDVGAMYPNIILSNRLQPSAIVDDAMCAACDFNQSKNNCKRRMDWVWRGNFNPASRAEYEQTKGQLSRETQRDGLTFGQLPEKEQATLVADRLKTYARKAYKKTKVTEEENRTDIVCMRENDFYVDTVRQFRDRRYEYKKLNKDWKKNLSNAKDAATKKQCEDRVLVYDSLQVAHKCILNSFYGYVMRKGARWRSMEMAGIVTKSGADMITQARILVEQIGRPLELDTDGIWCILPGSFPDVYTFELNDGSKLKLEYPCVMLNADAHEKFTNHQYQELVDPKKGTYKTKSECSIFFEVDGPYRCMVIPASIEEGKLLKKRYAVFNFDGSLAELKGFELKRRGELELIKTFQSQVFERFLEGSSLIECYAAVADVANHWIDVIDTRGDSLEDDELVDLISENRNMSRQLDDYGDQKGTSQTTARRLGEFLGAEIIKDKGLNCKFIIAEQPYGAPVTERAIPTAIWKAETGVMKHFLRKWLKSPGLDGDSLDMRNVLDWDYYLDRLGKTIQKIITIPAALQKVENPVPRVKHPSWLDTKVSRLNDSFQQKDIRSMFGVKEPIATDLSLARQSMDIEDMDGVDHGRIAKRPLVHKMRRKGKVSDRPTLEDFEEINKERVELSSQTFPAWLTQKKSVWRNSRRKNRFDQSGKEKKQRKAVSMEGFMREAAQSLTEKEWQILEVREMSSYDTLSPGSKSGSGEFVVWVMVGNSSLQKIHVSVPRTVYVATRKEITNTSAEISEFRRVDKRLPSSKRAAFVYEVSLPEYLYKSKKWIDCLRPVDPNDSKDDVFETVYEAETPLLTRILTGLGSISRLKQSATRSKKTYSLTDLQKVERPSEGEYLHSQLSYKRLFLYVRIHPKTKTGIVALFDMNGGSGEFHAGSEEPTDLTRPSDGPAAEFNIGATCSVWIVKPKTKNSQRNISLKQCENMFEQLLNSVIGSAGLDSEYSCVSSRSIVDVANLSFVDSEQLAFAGANETINSFSKAKSSTFILLSSSRPTSQLRRYMSTFSSMPVLEMAFPPGPLHDPTVSTLPSLNWEQPAVQLSLEAYLFLTVVSFPKRVSYCRYGLVPLGNLGTDENTVVYDVSLSRMIQKNRVLSWASRVPGRPDVGIQFVPSSDGGLFPLTNASQSAFTQDEIWGDDDELVSPVIRRPGYYSSICVDIDVQDLTIAALTSLAASVSSMVSNGGMEGNTDPSSPNSATMFDASFSFSKVAGPVGDEMSTAASLPIVKALVSGWLKDAITTDSLVADELLQHVYRLISNPDTLLHDPALHRVVHALMKSTFFILLGELQRLGCSIVYASFHRVTVATNKLQLTDAEEYIDFVIKTAKRQSNNDDQGDALSKVSLRPRQFHSNFLFLDEYNFGTMQLERMARDEVDESTETLADNEQDSSTVVVPNVVTAWSVMNYLASERAQQYFRTVMGRFSRDVMRKQVELTSQDDVLPIAGAIGLNDEVLAFKKNMVSKHFASYLTRAVGEIMKDGKDEELPTPPMQTEMTWRQLNPPLEFIKNVIAVFELDPDIEAEVQVLKRSLLSQIGVAEYAKAAQWVNPCPSFILPDVFCSECHESRDINLCYVPPRQADEPMEKQWACADCGAAYKAQVVEDRLLHMVHKKLVRYVLQDVRCTKTNRVATRALAPLSDCSAGLRLDTSPEKAHEDFELLYSLAEFHELDTLKETVGGVLSSYHM